MALVAKEYSYSVVIDDCNLYHSIWEPFAAAHDLAYIRQDLTNTSIEVCVERDAERPAETRVGRAVIENLARRAKLIPWPDDQRIVICDIDGTLADLSHRLPFIQQEPPDRIRFQGSIIRDSPIWQTIKWIADLKDQGFYIVLMSGRPTSVTGETMMWLNQQFGAIRPDRFGHVVEWEYKSLHFDRLFLRATDDHRPDTLVKAEMLHDIPKEKIKLVFDDRPSIVEMFRSYGLKVIQVSANSRHEWDMEEEQMRGQAVKA